MKKTILSILLGSIIFSVKAQEIKMHKVVKGETLYSISRQYSVTVREIVQANPELRKNDFHVKIGEELGIPNQTAEGSNKIKVQPVASTPGTPYSDEDNIVRTKPIAGNALATSANDVPVMGKPVGTVKDAETMPLRTASSNPAEYPVIFSKYMTHGFKAKKNRGAANYLGDNIQGNQYLAFYNDAENGSVIKVTNLMNKKTVFVKVVGKVPPTDASQEIVLKLSRKAAHELGAIDERFLVEVVSCTN